MIHAIICTDVHGTLFKVSINLYTASHSLASVKHLRCFRHALSMGDWLGEPGWWTLDDLVTGFPCWFIRIY